ARSRLYFRVSTASGMAVQRSIRRRAVRIFSVPILTGKRANTRQSPALSANARAIAISPENIARLLSKASWRALRRKVYALRMRFSATIKPEFFHKVRVSRFQREAEVLAPLNHSNYSRTGSIIFWNQAGRALGLTFP